MQRRSGRSQWAATEFAMHRIVRQCRERILLSTESSSLRAEFLPGAGRSIATILHLLNGLLASPPQTISRSFRTKITLCAVTAGAAVAIHSHDVARSAAAGMHAQHSSFEADVRARAIPRRLRDFIQWAVARSKARVIGSPTVRQVRPLVFAEALPRAPQLSARRSMTVSGTRVASGGGARDGGVGGGNRVKTIVTRLTATSNHTIAPTTTQGPIALGSLPIVPTVWYTAAELMAGGRSLQLRGAMFLRVDGGGCSPRSRAFRSARRGISCGRCISSVATRVKLACATRCSSVKRFSLQVRRFTAAFIAPR